ncbi:hypothetical protein O181_125771 [Austropuccinia psidii MF-1]|uniref:Uncharacterized protein n=1 Tax=Austropuccinia psidii MF-1 TaxID=1389203 RepID=A0A9Q3Q5C3_9BASI|nr:hypothetical protein [Austropuccinia psidii MF-1]MBW0586056.1 hypothetical protein [Austropuccinia psidii MF-1]
MHISSLGTSGLNSSNLKRKDIQMDENPGTAKKYNLTIREKSKSLASESFYGSTGRIQECKERQIQRSSIPPENKAIYKKSSTIHILKQEVSNPLESSHSQSLSQLRRSSSIS